MTYTASDAEALDYGFALPAGTDLIRGGDQAITQNARAAAGGIRSLRNRISRLKGDTALNRLRTYRAHPEGDLSAAVVGDTSWVRDWATQYATGLPESVQALHVAGATTTVLQPGAGTPPSGGATVVDDFTGDGPLNGRTPATGPAWVAGSGWVTSGGYAQQGPDVQGMAIDAGVSDDLDAVFDLDIVTMPDTATRSWRIYVGAGGPSASGLLGSGLWLSLALNTSGDVTASLYKTVGGTSTDLGSITVTGITKQTATPQPVRVALSIRGGLFSARLTTLDGATVYGQGNAAVTAADISGTHVGIGGFANASIFRLDRIEAGTPYVPGTAPETLTVTEVPGTHNMAARLPTNLDAALVDATAATSDDVQAARPNALTQLVAGQDVSALTMPGALVQRVTALEDTTAPLPTGSAFEPLRALKAFGAGEVTVAVVSDSTANDANDWIRLFAQKWGATLPGRVRRTYRSWDAAAGSWRATAVDAEGGDPNAPTSLDDTFTRTGALHGSVSDSGHVWSDTGGVWSTDGTHAVASGSGAASLDVGSRDVTMTLDLSVTTAAEASSRILRMYTGIGGSTVWPYLSIDTGGGLTAGLQKTVGGTSTALASPATVLGVTSDSATPQVVTVETVVSIQNVTVTITSAGQTTTLTGTLAESDVPTLGTGVGVNFAGGSALGGYTIDRFRASVSSTGDSTPTLEFHNGAIAGADLSQFDATLRAAMFGSVTPDVLILATGHNNGTQEPPAFTAEVAAWLDGWLAEHPDCAVLVSSQNPQVSPAGGIAAHRDRQAALRSWAKGAGHDYIPAFEAFTAKPDGGTSLIGSDGIHPTTPPIGTTTGDYGSVLWADTATNTL